MDTRNTDVCPHDTSNQSTQPDSRDDRSGWSAGPRLRRASEVDRDPDQSAPLPSVLRWVREFLGAPHPQLGRKGSVCPFVPLSLKMDTIWMAEISQGDLGAENISAIITDFRDLFLATEPISGPEAMNKAFLVVFPTLIDAGTAGAALVDEVQRRSKRYFVDMGLMLGEFHASNESPGLRNPAFRPLRSPIPMLAIRHMVDSDLPFLARETYTPAERSCFLRSYLSHVGGALTPPRFAQVLDQLVGAEIEMRAAGSGVAAARNAVIGEDYEHEEQLDSAQS